MNQITNITSDIKNKKLKPIYFLFGDEPYYIDEISDLIAQSILTEEEKSFNQMVLYGSDVSIYDVINYAKRFPMMAKYQVIIVKEAQHLSKTIENLAAYAENPTPTTILVICYKYKKLDGRKKLAKIVKKNGLLFESKKLYEENIPNWITDLLADKGYKIEVKAALMLTEYLGTDLGKILKEIEKLMSILPKGNTISALAIEENIGISKDYNIFELRKAIGIKDVVKANKIINYFEQNPKSNPLPMTLSLLFGYFVQLLQYHGLADKSKNQIARALKISPYFAGDYITAGKNYPMRKVSQIIAYLNDADVKSKGIGASNLPDGEILKELLFKIMH